MTGAAPVLEVEGLRVRVGEREILSGIDLVIREGETHVLLGPNGSGKTTLLNTIVGFPGYEVTAGRIGFRGQDLLPLEIDQRARLGIGLAYQHPPAVRGVRLRQMLAVVSAGARSAEELQRIAEHLNVDAMLDRDVNTGFSGGETKRSEMAQVVAQAPALAMFDEPESGVDLENVELVGDAISALLKGERPTDHPRAGLIITHTGHILDYVSADIGHVLFDGRLACQGDPRDLIDEISRQGYEKCVGCVACRR